MRVELPDCARCCFCLPLRRGILTFGYLNLVFTIFLVGLEIRMSMFYDKMYKPTEILQSSGTYIYRGVGLFSQMWFFFILCFMEIIFNVVLLIGAHTKRPRLIRAYYFYGITSSLAAFVCYILVHPHRGWIGFDYHLFEFCLAFSGLVLQVYLLLLIRSELKKLDAKTQTCFVNHAAEVYVSYNEEGRNPL